jgi:hypothetical protein
VFLGATPLVHTYRYYDITTPTTKKKPLGAIALEFWAKPSTTPITDPNALDKEATVTKTPFTVDWRPEDVGKTVYTAARWITRTGKVGPWSDIVANVIV